MPDTKGTPDQVPNWDDNSGETAQSSLSARNLAHQLKLDEAAWPFESDGTLTKQAIQESREIMPNSTLGNPKIPAGFDKYATRSYQSTHGTFQVHFYYNRATGTALYDFDYKAVFARSIGQ